MTNQRKLTIIFGILSCGLLVTLLIKLTNIPSGIILSGFYLGGMILVGILIGCLILTGILKLIIKKFSFLTLLSILTTISFLVFHYYLYSPILKIQVPNGFKGEVDLVLSNVKENILIIDSNGIGYINKWTFNKTYSKPIVNQTDGKNLDNFLIGYNPSTFFAKGKTCCVGNRQIQSLTFKIGTKPNLKDEDFEFRDITKFVDKTRVILIYPD